jgi:hypothetical protein
MQSSNHHLKPGDRVCRNQAIASPTRVRVACTTVRRVLWIENTADLSQCEQPLPLLRRCAISPTVACAPMRSELSQNKPLLLRPYGEILLSPPTAIEWAPVTGADRYAVTILGDKTWTLSSAQPHLTLLALSKSGSLQFVIEAFNQDRLLGSSTTTFNLLGAAQAKQVYADLAWVDQLPVTPEEKDTLRESIFSEAGLLENAIALAKRQAQAQPTNPVALRQLGDLMLEAGWLEDANAVYQKARAIATKIQNQAEIERSESGLRSVATWTKESLP